MTYATTSINPFYANRHRHPAPVAPEKPDQPVYARLPRAPITASPVPHLTSLYHFHRPGEYGDRKWPGNCGGNLIKDLLTYFKPGLVFDPMTRQRHLPRRVRGTRHPVHGLGHPPGLRRLRPDRLPAGETFDFIWAHPPYWRQKLYADDPRDLSRCPTLEQFLRRYGQFIRNCKAALKPGGKLAILMGDYSDREAGFVPLVYHTKRLAFAAGLKQHCTDIIRFSHGSQQQQESLPISSFIPGLHDVCMIFDRPALDLPANIVAYDTTSEPAP